MKIKDLLHRAIQTDNDDRVSQILVDFGFRWFWFGFFFATAVNWILFGIIK